MLTYFTGIWVVIYGGLGALLTYFYVAPPVRYGYRGKGYGELSILISFGVLPVMGSYYVQTAMVDWRPLLASLPVGILTTLLLFHHHFLHWRADKQAGKKTLVVVLGVTRALRVSTFITWTAYVSLLSLCWPGHCRSPHCLP